MRANTACSILLLNLSATVSAAQTPQPNDPLELQRRAVARIDSVIDQFRRTGDTRLQVSELLQAGAELSASNRALAARQNWSALAFGLIKEGHVHRLQGQWAEAIPFYQSAQEAATRGRDVVRQTTRSRGARSRNRRGGISVAAVSIATQAVQLAETTSDKNVLARALDVLGSAQIAQLNLVGAGETTNREVAVAEQATDPTAAYYAYLNRSGRLSQARRAMRLQHVVRRVQPGVRSRQEPISSRPSASCAGSATPGWCSKPTHVAQPRGPAGVDAVAAVQSPRHRQHGGLSTEKGR